jgi:hypothetical protein
MRSTSNAKSKAGLKIPFGSKFLYKNRRIKLCKKFNMFGTSFCFKVFILGNLHRICLNFFML